MPTCGLFVRRKNYPPVAYLQSLGLFLELSFVSSANQLESRDNQQITSKVEMTSSGWQEYKAEGNSSYTAGKTQEAVDFYTKSLQCADLPATDRATILCNRAQCYLKLSDNAKAAEDCTACLTLSPDNVKALFRRCALGNPESPGNCCIGRYAHGTKPRYTFPSSHMCRAAALEALGDQNEALRDYRDVVRLSPQVADAAAGVKRLEAALGLTPSHVSPSSVDGRLQLTESEMRSLQEVSGRVKEVRRQKARAQAQQAAAAKEKRSVQLTQSTLGTLPEGTKVYRGIGRMFLASPRPEMDSALGERASKAEARLKVCDNTLAYLGAQESEAEGAYVELVKDLRTKQGK